MKTSVIIGLTIFAIIAFFVVLAFGAKPQPVGPRPVECVDSVESQKANTLVLIFNSGPIIVNLSSILPGNLPIEHKWHKCHVMNSFNPPYFYVNKLFGFLRIRWDGCYYDVFIDNESFNVFAVRADILGEMKYWKYEDSHTWFEISASSFQTLMYPLCKESIESCRARGIDVRQ